MEAKGKRVLHLNPAVLELLKWAASLFGIPLFLILCKRIEKFLDTRDILPDKQQTEIIQLREHVKQEWDEGFRREQRLLVTLGLLAGLVRRTDALIVSLDGMTDHFKIDGDWPFQKELDDVREFAEKVNGLEELKLH